MYYRTAVWYYVVTKAKFVRELKTEARKCFINHEYIIPGQMVTVLRIINHTRNDTVKFAAYEKMNGIGRKDRELII